jgi:choloylglycine hydrolase
MQPARGIFACLFALAGLAPLGVGACTTFCLKDGDAVIFGRNFDFPAGEGQLHVNQRGVRKTAFIAPPERPLTWTAVYGSISFNQNGREFPYGGMNEAGLVIEQMMHEDQPPGYPALDARYGLEELQWIQYQLDMSATVAQVIASDAAVRISPASIAPLHFLAADAQGSIAAIEFVGGKLVVHAGESLSCAALANTTYAVSLAYQAKLAAAEGGSARARTKSSLDRFATAAALAAAYDRADGSPVDYAFSVLDSVSSGGTQWSIVYDSRDRTLHYRTRANRDIRQLAMSSFDFSCSSPRLCVDIEANARGSADFSTYSYESNLKLIETVWSSVEFLRSLPQELRIAWARYPDAVVCAGAD